MCVTSGSAVTQKTPWGGGWKNEGGGTPHEWHPSQNGVLDPPPSYGTSSTPLRCQCSVFPVQKSTTEQTRCSFGGVPKSSGERVLWYVVLPPYVLHPRHITAQVACKILGNYFRRNHYYRRQGLSHYLVANRAHEMTQSLYSDSIFGCDWRIEAFRLI